MDERGDGSEIQDYLLQKTGQRTVPNIFISMSITVDCSSLVDNRVFFSDQKHIGGCDSVVGLKEQGKLTVLVKA